MYSARSLRVDCFTQALTRENIIGGLRKSGVYPLNRQAICVPGEKPAPPHSTHSTAMESGINFLPLYSPANNCENW